MKKAALYVVAVFFLTGCAAENTYQIIIEPNGAKIITGRFHPSVLEYDSSFLWYRHNYDGFKPDSASIAFLSTVAQGVHFIVVGGTWCGDTKRELPKFFKTVSLAHIPEKNIELYGVDRTKKSKDGLTEKYKVTRVPTFILISDGKEIGRIVEYSAEGVEFDMANLLKRK